MFVDLFSRDSKSNCKTRRSALPRRKNSSICWPGSEMSLRDMSKGLSQRAMLPSTSAPWRVFENLLPVCENMPSGWQRRCRQRQIPLTFPEPTLRQERQVDRLHRLPHPTERMSCWPMHFSPRSPWWQHFFHFSNRCRMTPTTWSVTFAGRSCRAPPKTTRSGPRTARCRVLPTSGVRLWLTSAVNSSGQLRRFHHRHSLPRDHLLVYSRLSLVGLGAVWRTPLLCL
mmetsp:Transcript_17926/g.39565  ORF Transcript_17926/g.39565 Transcript_17926/m.39565 type:complete len:227 (+) Transcript_17926:1216-1896(+)